MSVGRECKASWSGSTAMSTPWRDGVRASGRVLGGFLTRRSILGRVILLASSPASIRRTRPGRCWILSGSRTLLDRPGLLSRFSDRHGGQGEEIPSRGFSAETYSEQMRGDADRDLRFVLTVLGALRARISRETAGSSNRTRSVFAMVGDELKVCIVGATRHR